MFLQIDLGLLIFPNMTLHYDFEIINILVEVHQTSNCNIKCERRSRKRIITLLSYIYFVS